MLVLQPSPARETLLFLSSGYQGASSFLGNVMDIAALGVLAIDYLSALESDLDATRSRIGLGMCVVLIAGGINFKGTAILEKYSIAFAAIAVELPSTYAS